MASHVTIVDQSFKRATVQTNPEMQLIDVFREACRKLNRSPETSGLKHNNKILDLTLSLRFSGLAPGAKLELAVISRSPSLVSVALQLTEAESTGAPRLSNKYTSDTSLWKILRDFESGHTTKYNFTARGVEEVEASGIVHGKVVYETPVVQVMSKQISSFTDLQKSLAQLGFHSGTVLLRLSFKKTSIAIEAAMQQISEYFSDSDRTTGAQSHDSRAVANSPGVSADSSVASAPTDTHTQAPHKDQIRDFSSLGQRAEEFPHKGPARKQAMAENDLEEQIVVYAPPQSNIPKAAQTIFDERDYEPTHDHARYHQKRLLSAGLNKKLLSDAEAKAQVDEQNARLANVNHVDVKFRFPDQTQVIISFTNRDTTETLFVRVRRLLDKEDEPFMLQYASSSGPKLLEEGVNKATRLVDGLGMTGKVLVNVIWGKDASSDARHGRALKEQYMLNAKQIEVPEPEAEMLAEEKQQVQGPPDKRQDERRPAIPKWLKLSQHKK